MAKIGKALGILCLGFALGCSTTRPCSEAGDVGWPTEIKNRGDKVCYQKELESGETVNHGTYKQLYRNGKVAVEGQFLEGKKHGVWTEYDEEGNPKAERYFDHGVDKPQPPAAAQSK